MRLKPEPRLDISCLLLSLRWCNHDAQQNLYAVAWNHRGAALEIKDQPAIYKTAFDRIFFFFRERFAAKARGFSGNDITHSKLRAKKTNTLFIHTYVWVCWALGHKFGICGWFSFLDPHISHWKRKLWSLVLSLRQFGEKQHLIYVLCKNIHSRQSTCSSAWSFWVK